MPKSGQRTSQLLMTSIVALGVCLGTLAQASDRIYITVHNCSNSHHVLHVKVSSDNQAKSDSEGKVHSGDEKEFFCKSDNKCDVLLYSDVVRLNKNTSRSPWYVYISSKHNIKASTSESEVCG